MDIFIYIHMAWSSKSSTEMIRMQIRTVDHATKMDNMANVGNTANMNQTEDEDDPNWNEWGSWNKSANMNPTEDEDQTDPNWNEWGGSWRICNWCSSYTYKGKGVP